MIKIANNLQKLCANKATQNSTNFEKAALFTAPSAEEQVLERLSPELARKARVRERFNSLLGGASGAALGAAIGAPFAGVGAIPGAFIGGLGGALTAPRLIENLASSRTEEGAKLINKPEVKELLNSIEAAKNVRLLKSLGIGSGIGALAGLPFAGVGAIPGALIGLGVGGMYNKYTENPTVTDLANRKDAIKIKKQLEKIIADNNIGE